MQQVGLMHEQILIVFSKSRAVKLWLARIENLTYNSDFRICTFLIRTLVTLKSFKLGMYAHVIG